MGNTSIIDRIFFIALIPIVVFFSLIILSKYPDERSSEDANDVGNEISSQKDLKEKSYSRVSKAVKTVERYYEALNNNDIDEVMSIFKVKPAYDETLEEQKESIEYAMKKMKLYIFDIQEARIIDDAFVEVVVNQRFWSKEEEEPGEEMRFVFLLTEMEGRLVIINYDILDQI